MEVGATWPGCSGVGSADPPEGDPDRTRRSSEYAQVS